MLFLPCTREEKYSAKQAIDSFFFRMGDVLSAVLVFVGTSVGLSASGFAKLNLALAVVFITLAVMVGRAYVGPEEQADRGRAHGGQARARLTPSR